MKALFQSTFSTPSARRAIRALTGLALLWQAPGHLYGQTLPSCALPTGCNVLSNPSFEQTINGACPGDISGVGSRPAPGAKQETAKPTVVNPVICSWFTGTSWATPDHFNACAPAPTSSQSVLSVGVPCNFATLCTSGQTGGSQPALTGNGYVGLFGFVRFNGTPPAEGYDVYDYREYVAQKVQLQPGVRYYAAFRANIAPLSGIAIPNLGMAFTSLPSLSSTTRAAYSGFGRIPLTPAVSGGVAATPQANWNRIQGTFTASGTETQAIIGNFGPGYGPAPTYTPPFTAGPGATVANPPNRELVNGAYYFIEDVVLQPMPTAGNNRQVACGQTITLGTCALPASSGATYNWAPTTGLTNANTATPTLLANGNTASQYMLTVTLPGGQQYTTSARVAVSAPNLVITPGSPGPYCLGSPLTLTASGGEPGAQYTWSSPSFPGFSAVGQSIVVTPGSAGAATYVVSTTCGGFATSVGYDLDVRANCCLLAEYQSQGRPIYTVAGDYYTQNPFTQGPNAVYHIINNGTGGAFVNLLGNQVYTLAPGSILLFDADCGLSVQTGAQLEFSGARFTAACDDMWGGISVTGTGSGIRTFDPANPNGPRSTIEHCSSNSIYLLDNPNVPQAPHFQISNVDFRQNYVSVVVGNVTYPSTANDWIRDCTFDSDPAAYRLDHVYPGNGYAGWYSEGHIGLHGDLRASALSNNTFDHAMAGVIATRDYSWFNLEGNTFRNCFMGGIIQVPSMYAADIPHAPAGQTEVRLYKNNFYLPSFQPSAGQQYSAMGVTAQGNDASTLCYGVLLCAGRVDAQYNTFEQEDPLTRLNYDDYPNIYRQAQVGMAVYDLHSIEGNTFTRLETGIIVNPLNGSEGAITGNLFDDCHIGVHATTLANLVYALPNVPVATSASPTLFTSCNTFLRNGSRDGLATGILLTEAPYTPNIVGAPLVLDDFNSPGAGHPLKDLFDPQGRGPGDFASIDNQTSYPVKYFTFTAQVNDYQALAVGPVNFIDAGPIDLTATPSNPNPWQPCYLDGHGQSGVQMRGGVKRAAAVSTDAPARLAQNVPNPCSGSTVISYALPTGTKQAGLLIRRGLDGVLVEELPLKTAAKEQQVDLRHYAPGLYFYTLTANGVPVETKRMLVE